MIRTPICETSCLIEIVPAGSFHFLCALILMRGKVFYIDGTIPKSHLTLWGDVKGLLHSCLASVDYQRWFIIRIVLRELSARRTA